MKISTQGDLIKLDGEVFFKTHFPTTAGDITSLYYTSRRTKPRSPEEFRGLLWFLLEEREHRLRYEAELEYEIENW